MPEPRTKTQELVDKRAQLAAQMRAIMDEPAGEDGNLSAEQETTFDRLHNEQEALAATIEQHREDEAKHQARVERMRGVESSLAQTTLSPAAAPDTRDVDELTDEERQQEADQAYDRAFDAWLRFGERRLTPEALGTLMTRAGRPVDEMRGALPPEIRAQSIGQDTAGGFFVPEGFMNTIVEAVTAFGGMRRARTTVINTSTGQDLPIPTDDDTSNTGAILPENTENSEQDVAVGQIVLGAHTYTSKLVKVSRQLLQDSAFDIQAWLGRKLGMRIGRITNTHFTTGDGAAKPFGLVTQAATGVTAAAKNDFTVDELYDLKHSVDPDYRAMGPQWMFADATLKNLKKKKDGEGRPIWQPGLIASEPSTIDGDNYVVNQQMPALTTGLSPIAYGDMSLYYIRDVLGVQLLRLDERFATALQVAFLAFSRHDGALIDAGTNPVKKLTLS